MILYIPLYYWTMFAEKTNPGKKLEKRLENFFFMLRKLQLQLTIQMGVGKKKKKDSYEIDNGWSILIVRIFFFNFGDFDIPEYCRNP